MFRLRPLRRSLTSAAALSVLVAGLVFLGTRPAPAVTDNERGEIEAIIKDYLLKNPEILRDALMELQRRADAEENKARSAALKEHSALLFDSPRGVVLGNRNGDVTVVEFFDYNCGYCKRALEDMDGLLKADSKLKFVMKEFPVLGPGSVEASRVSIALRMQDKDGTKYHDFHRRLLSGRGEANRARALAAAKEAGADMTRIEKDMQSPEVEATLAESAQLADALGISGTPSYVVGDEVVPGAVGQDALKEKIASVRKCGSATC